MDGFKGDNEKPPGGDRYCLKVDNSGSADSSSRSPSPNRSIRGLNLFRMISQKIGKSAKKWKETINSDDDEDSNSSSNSLTKKGNSELNECDCDYLYKLDRNMVMLSAKNHEAEKRGGKSKMGQEYRSRNERCLRFSTPYNGYHSSGSDPYSSNDDSFNSNDSDQAAGAQHFSSNDSSASSSSGSYRNSRAIVRKVLKSLNINSRSLSCSSISQMKEMSLNDRREMGSKEKRTKKSPQKILRQPVTYTYVRGISGLPTHRVVNTRGCYNNQYSRG